MLLILSYTVSVLNCKGKAGVDSFSALTSIFQSTQFLEEITRLTLETKRTGVITDLRKVSEGRVKIQECLLSESKTGILQD